MKLLGFVVVAGALVTAALGCGTPPMPKGPPPEYEEPPAPSWLDASVAPSATTPQATSPADASAE